MTRVITSITVSAVHAANMRRELEKARTLEDLQRIADKHAPYLLGKDKDALRIAWARRRAQLGGG